jgi:hypothetical protein
MLVGRGERHLPVLPPLGLSGARDHVLIGLDAFSNDVASLTVAAFLPHRGRPDSPTVATRALNKKGVAP